MDRRAEAAVDDAKSFLVVLSPFAEGVGVVSSGDCGSRFVTVDNVVEVFLDQRVFDRAKPLSIVVGTIEIDPLADLESVEVQVVGHVGRKRMWGVEWEVPRLWMRNLRGIDLLMVEVMR